MKSLIKIDYQKKIVTKKCKTRQEYLREIAIYEKSFSFVPRLLAHDYSTLSIEYINGETIGSLANPDFSKLGKIFAGLHSHKNKSSLSICHNDTNPKNYLVDKNGKYFMIDFSDWTFDYPEKDLIHFLMFWCSIYSHKKLKLSSELFLNSYQKKQDINPIIWKKFYNEIEIKFDERRKRFNKKEILASNILKSNRSFLQNIF